MSIPKEVNDLGREIERKIKEVLQGEDFLYTLVIGHIVDNECSTFSGLKAHSPEEIGVLLNDVLTVCRKILHDNGEFEKLQILQHISQIITDKFLKHYSREIFVEDLNKRSVN